jgi:general stress protein YciG
MMLNEDFLIASSAAELADLFVDLLGADYVQDGMVTLELGKPKVSLDECFAKMDTGKRGAVHVQGFLEVVAPASAAEFKRSQREVQMHMRQSFSQKRPTARGGNGASADDRVHEAEMARDGGYIDFLPLQAFEYDDDEADSGDEWYDAPSKHL